MRTLLLLFFSMIWRGLVAQTSLPAIPDSLELNTVEDYRKLERDVEKCLKWLCTAPYGQDIVYRSEANAFVLAWLAGTPDYTVVVESKNFDFGSFSEELIYSFVHAKTYLMLTRGEKWEESKLNLEAMKIVCTLIISSEKMSKNKELKPLIKAYNKDRLEDYLKSKEQAR